MKKVSRVVLFVVALIMLFATGCAKKSYDLAAEEGDIYAGTVPTISVTGTGKLEVAPDTANISFRVNAKEDTAEKAQQAIADAISAVTKAIEQKGVDVQDVQTEDYYVYQEYEYDNKGNRTDKYWYYAYTSVNVKVRDIDNVSAVIDSGVSAGADFTGGIYFTLEDRSAYEGEALKLAYDNAYTKAGIVCEAAGHEVGEAIVITDGTTEMPEVIYDEAVRDEAPEEGWASSGASNSVSPGTLTIRANVTVRFIME